jgi:hypothetical protein
MSLTHEVPKFEDVEPHDGPAFELNPQQKEAVRAIREFLDDESASFFGLYGYAGTGKTTTIHRALEDYRGRVAMSAPTHKAVGVLAGMDVSGDVDFATIHRLLGCRKQKKDGEIFFAPDTSKGQAIHGYDVVVIDECSMIGTEMWGWITDAVEQSGDYLKIIVMGDPCQLPPVNDGEASPTFDLPCARLTEIMRHQGVIEQAATTMRETLDPNQRVRELPLASDACDEHGEISNLAGSSKRPMQSPFMRELLDDLETAKVLAYTNKAVNYVNALIRLELFGEDAQPFEPGERLVLVETYNDGIYGMLHTETEVNVEAAMRDELFDIDCWRLKVTGVEGGRYELFTLDDGQKGEFYRRLRKARDRGKAGGGWGEYYDLKEGFARVRPGWATTIHKSQGSTYDQVYLIQTDVISTTRDKATRAMLLYVAYSRARKKLVIS